MGQPDLVVASNRGPLSFGMEAGHPVLAGSAGGLAATLHPLLNGSGATWVFCAMSDADRLAEADGMFSAEGLSLSVVQPQEATYQMAYDVVSNSTLWFLHHHLFDISHRPAFDWRWRMAWDAYRAYNTLFADAIAKCATDAAVVLLQDYHLALVPGMLRVTRPDLRSVHFTHTPYADPSAMRILPDFAAQELLEGMAGATACGFHTDRWRQAFLACCADYGITTGASFVSPLSPDAALLADRITENGCITAGVALDAMLGDRRLVLRVDRMEPTKNLLRGFRAFDELLQDHPEWRGTVVFLAHAYSSRQSLPEYLAYAAEVEHAAKHVNDKWATDDWTPVVLEVADKPDQSLAALTRYDVLLVNPLRDGLNLVAKEGPLVNCRDGVLALSREAGAYVELAEAAIEINPYDITGTAGALHLALSMSSTERSRHADQLRSIVEMRQPEDWLAEQIAAAGV